MERVSHAGVVHPTYNLLRKVASRVRQGEETNTRLKAKEEEKSENSLWVRRGKVSNEASPTQRT